MPLLFTRAEVTAVKKKPPWEQISPNLSFSRNKSPFVPLSANWIEADSERERERERQRDREREGESPLKMRGGGGGKPQFFFAFFFLDRTRKLKTGSSARRRRRRSRLVESQFPLSLSLWVKLAFYVPTHSL